MEGIFRGRLEGWGCYIRPAQGGESSVRPREAYRSRRCDDRSTRISRSTGLLSPHTHTYAYMHVRTHARTYVHIRALTLTHTHIYDAVLVAAREDATRRKDHARIPGVFDHVSGAKRAAVRNEKNKKVPVSKFLFSRTTLKRALGERKPHGDEVETRLVLVVVVVIVVIVMVLVVVNTVGRGEVFDTRAK